jgi:hypothetical protein
MHLDRKLLLPGLWPFNAFGIELHLVASPAWFFCAEQQLLFFPEIQIDREAELDGRACRVAEASGKLHYFESMKPARVA